MFIAKGKDLVNLDKVCRVYVGSNNGSLVFVFNNDDELMMPVSDAKKALGLITYGIVQNKSIVDIDFGLANYDKQ